MKNGLSVWVLLFLTCLWGCSTVTDSDVASLESQNDYVKIQTLNRLTVPPGFLVGLFRPFSSQANERKAVDTLVKMINADNPKKDIQVGVLRVLGQLGKENKFSSDVIIQKIGNIDPDIQVVAIEAAGKIKCRQAVPALYKIVERDQNRRTALWALGEIGDKSAVEMLNRLLTNPDMDTRYLAGRTLAKLK